MPPDAGVGRDRLPAVAARFPGDGAVVGAGREMLQCRRETSLHRACGTTPRHQSPVDQGVVTKCEDTVPEQRQHVGSRSANHPAHRYSRQTDTPSPPRSRDGARPR